jgi:hypothetical protein
MMQRKITSLLETLRDRRLHVVDGDPAHGWQVGRGLGGRHVALTIGRADRVESELGLVPDPKNRMLRGLDGLRWRHFLCLHSR